MYRIFLVEDEIEVAQLLALAILRSGFEVAGHATSGEAALAEIVAAQPDLALLDIGLSGRLDGIQTALRLRELCDVPVVFVSGAEDARTIERAKSVEPHGYLFKPFRERELACAIDLALLRKRAERRVHERERLISTMLRALGEAVVTVNAAHEITFINPAGERLLGLGAREVIGRPLAAVVTMQGRPRDGSLDEVVASVIEDERIVGPRPGILLAAAGQRVVEDMIAPLVDDRGLTTGAVIVVRDVAELRQLQNEVAISDRLVSLGTVGAGIAHEINTPVQYIGDSVRFLQGALEDMSALTSSYRRALAQMTARHGDTEAELSKEIAEAEAAADLEYLQNEVPQALRRSFDGINRITRVVRVVQQIGRSATGGKQRVDLVEVLAGTLVATEGEYRDIAQIESHLAELPEVLCDPAEMSQVFQSLIVNAAHAIAEVVPAGAKGSIRVELDRCDNYAVVNIRDTGPGIPDAIRGRIFDPFFTTKPTGKGTGNGLAIARSIVVEKHGGSLTFHSEPGKGSTFTVKIPLLPL